MGWALKNLPEQERKIIAASLFEVTEESGDWLNGLCPLHGDSNPSFGYNFAEDVYHCLAGCEKDGDLVDLFCHIEQLDAKEGFITFKKRFGDSSGFVAEPKRGNGRKKAASAPTDVDFDQMAAAYEQMAELPSAWVDRLEEKRRWSTVIISKMGLKLQTLYRDKKGELRPVKKGRERVVMPVYDCNGDLKNLRLYDPAAQGENKILSWAKGTGKSRLYPYPSPGKKDGLAWLCEGEGDMLCGRSMGLEAYTQTAKLMEWPADQVRAFKDRDVVICYDADEAGVKYARGAAESLLGTARSIRIIQWPDYMMTGIGGELPVSHGEDLTDFIVKHGGTRKGLELLLPAAINITGIDELQTEPYWEFWGWTANKRQSFQPMLLAKRLQRDFSLLHDPLTGLLYSWDGKYFAPYHKDNLRQIAIKYLDTEANSSRVEDAVKLAVLDSTMPNGRMVNDRPGWNCLRNGMFNINTGELVPHDQDFYATVMLDIDFNPANPPPPPARWLRFLQETIQTEKPIRQLQEFFGYCLTRETRYETCLITIGDGGDGKSTMQRILRVMVGPDNCSSISFDALEDQFQRVSLYNKLLNLSSEVGGRAMDSEYFKKIVSGDSISAAFKHKDGFEFIPYAKLVFAVNKMPKILDSTDGLYRRILPIHFKRQFLPGDPARDPHLEEKLLEELPGIFAWSLVGLQRLRQRGCFDLDCDETINMLSSYKRQNSPVYAFVQDCCLTGASFESRKIDLYEAYKKYCAKRGFGAVHYENFCGDLRRAVKGLKSTRPRVNGKREQFFEGIGLVVEGVGDE